MRPIRLIQVWWQCKRLKCIYHFQFCYQARAPEVPDLYDTHINTLLSVQSDKNCQLQNNISISYWFNMRTKRIQRMLLLHETYLYLVRLALANGMFSLQIHCVNPPIDLMHVIFFLMSKMMNLMHNFKYSINIESIQNAPFELFRNSVRTLWE